MRANNKITEIISRLDEHSREILLFYNSRIRFSGTIKHALEATFEMPPEELYTISKSLEDMGLIDAMSVYNSLLST